ncbi:MAG: nucleoside-diphosphate kinase [Bacteroidetes bacterium]|nr:nucleoside-diphosphate kinase [Bacteroidota bacterium]MCL5737850.1 nucleoside-diphosphate kinase [Bacteroidota bacterium]
MSRTLAILKPDCVRRNLVGEVTARIQKANFKIIGLKMVRLTKETAGEFYAVHKERPFYNDLVKFMTSGACVPMVLEKENAFEEFRKFIGATDPKEAVPGTIRRDFAESKQENIVHGSDSPENAEREIGFFFSEQELVELR